MTADLWVDSQDASLLGVPVLHRLDALAFTGPRDAIRGVCVASAAVVVDRRHAAQQALAARFADAMAELWEGGGG